MILGLPPILQNANISVNIPGRIRHDRQELGRIDMIRTAACNQDAARTEHLERTQVEFLVTSKGGFEVLLSFGEGGGIQHNSVVPLAASRVVPQKVECIRLDPLNLAIIQRCVALGHFKCRTRTVYSSDAGTRLSQM